MEKEKEVLKKVREFMILNLEIKKLLKELNFEDIYEEYERVTKILRKPNIELYRRLYNAVLELEYNGKKRKEIPWFPRIDYDKCKNCKKCVEFCPRGVYDIEDGKVKVKYPYNCIVNCNACAEMCCDNKAIIFPNKTI
ncbi:4Fe-4S ferredoxin iron-sulfur binding domain protein [Methanocaldococcus villosus KIN24-T80]|uniref:4Fe-4S ferredoxin iron-sulfur binding domain protein n=1 Tax=Methanocaldococcus villosus KIN24-T80 TaxID=1069083 RepID=N6VZN4_9EURY|nr:ferredoxin family protein [Methanocaldococcus villosus]ENN96557.1 4Fe-4S ferredoxin iron-sulfur binding domain protein [Methanocaldococcus villosus KIN24-T80]